jgi:hypothetical protein
MASVGQQARAELAASLKDRHEEIEQVALTRVFAIGNLAETADPEYVEALRAAVNVAIEYGISVIESGEQGAPPFPVALLMQARLAARNSVTLDTVLRRYLAGYNLFSDFLMQEATGIRLREPWLKQILRDRAGLFDRFIAAIAEEYAREARPAAKSLQQRRADRVRRLLAGELLDTDDLEYDLGGWHVAAVACGSSAGEIIPRLADALQLGLLILSPADGTTWAWLGSRREIDKGELRRASSRAAAGSVSLAFGEPGHHLTGWRFSHRQAQAALPIALRGQLPVVHYADVALLARALGDDLLSVSLHRLYLAPLAAERDGGACLKDTLRAYFRSDHHVSSTAAALGTTRQTVARRLKVIEELIGQPLDTCWAEIDLALRLEELGT